MPAIYRSIRVALLGTVAAALFGVSSALASVVALATTTALVMGGTSNPLAVPQQAQWFVDGYVIGAKDRYINHNAANCDTDCTLVGAATPEEFVPSFGQLTFNQSVAQGVENLDKCLTGQTCLHTRIFPQSGTATTTFPNGPEDSLHVFGYSQSASIVTLEKRRLAQTYAPGEGPDVSFYVIGNPDRANGGFLARFIDGFTIPFLDVTFFGATPTDTGYATEDYTRQYDGWSDAPKNPTNLIADLNALIGIAVLHSDYFGPKVGQPVLQDQYGDTTFYMIPTKTLPLLSWLDSIPGFGPFVAAVLDAPLRVLIEASYDRTSSPGQPGGWNPLYVANPLLLPLNFLLAMPTGWDDALSQATGLPWLRPFFTTPAGPYGVGGPPVTRTPTTDQQNQVSSLSIDESASPAPAADQPSAIPQSPDARTLDGLADDGEAHDGVVPEVASSDEAILVADPPTEAGTPDADNSPTEAPGADILPTEDANAPAEPSHTEHPAATSLDCDEISPLAVETPRPSVRNPVEADRRMTRDRAPLADADGDATGSPDPATPAGAGASNDTARSGGAAPSSQGDSSGDSGEKAA